MKWVWVVEMWMGNRWEPCITCRLTRHNAAMALRVWQGNMPDDRFRVAKYIRSSNRGICLKTEAYQHHGDSLDGATKEASQ